MTRFFRMCALIVSGMSAASAAPLGTGFTYQGQLKLNGTALNGAKTLRFSLWDAQNTSPGAGGNQLGIRQLVANVPISNGTFTVTLNAAGEFGASAFSGEARFVQIEVCEDAGCGVLTVLSPRQAITGAPYALGPWVPSAGSITYVGGNVGIGTAFPAAALDVRGPLQIVNAGDQADVLWLGTERSWVFRQERTGSAAALKLESVGGGGNKDFLIKTTGVVGIGGASSDALMVTSSRVGIGTPNPAATLDVNGDVYLTNPASILASGRIRIAQNPVEGGSTRLIVGNAGNTSTGNGAHVTNGGVWTNGSDRNTKRGFAEIDKQEILDKVAKLPVTQWQYKGEQDGVKHIGPVAQDFRAAFGLGEDERYIGTVDADGVALAAIQALHEESREKDCRIAEQAEENAMQREMIADLNERLARLEGALAQQR